eukprot:COSAG04_NODE_6233_length_1377_cov_1.309859_3_plen_26_part_01
MHRLHRNLTLARHGAGKNAPFYQLGA